MICRILIADDVDPASNAKRGSTRLREIEINGHMKLTAAEHWLRDRGQARTR